MRLVRRLYAALLALYPREFRDDVGDDLRRAFDAALTEAHRAGRRGIGRGLAEVTDLALNLPAAWWERWTSREGSRRPGRTGRSMTKTSGGAMDGVVQDVRYAVRSIRSRPGFTAVVVLTLALGIGASAAVVGVVDGILLDPLPYPDADELVYMYESYREDQTKSVSYPNYLDWRQRNRVFEDLAARTSWSFTLTGRGEAREVTARLMSANLLDVLGVAPVVGRGFTADEEARGERTVLLGGELWAAVFASDPSVVGRTVTLDGEPWTVVGVLPRGLEFPLGGADVFAPTTVMSEGDRSSRGSHPGISVIARLREGADLEAAVADMDAVARALSREYPETNAEAGVVVRSLRERYVGAARPTVLVLAGAVLLVLLVSCANVASLLLVRGQTRTREAAVRVALGAGRARVARTYATECLVLAGLGGLLGAVLSWGGVDAFRTLAADLPRATRVRADGTVLAAAVGVSILAALLVGLVPAVRLSSTDPAVRLRTGTPGGGGGRREGRLRSGLVMAEVALSFVLLAGSALMLRSMVNLLNEDPGLQPRGVLTARVSVPRTRYPENGDRVRFYDRVLERVRSLPGVVAAGAGDPLPLSGNNRQWGISGEGLENVGPDGLRADHGMVTPGYFEALGITLLAGRTFTAADGPDAPVAVIDATMAERLWPGGTALGREVTFQGDGPRATVVGVVAHVKHYGVNEEGRVQIYLPHTVRVWSLSVVVRTTGDPVALAPALRRAVAEVDPAVPVSRIRTMEDMFGETIATERLAARVLTAFAGVAVLLALLGLYGVISWSVGRRTREIGIRMALGARGRSVAARITAGGLLLAGGGVLLGLTGAVAATRALSGLLFGVEARDPVTLAAVGAALLVVAAVATLVPALRATRVDPARTLRAE